MFFGLSYLITMSNLAPQVPKIILNHLLNTRIIYKLVHHKNSLERTISWSLEERRKLSFSLYQNVILPTSNGIEL